MKIAFLTPEFPHPKTGKSGGIGTSIYNLSKSLVVLGHQVTLLIYSQNKDEYFVENSIAYHKIKNIKVKGVSLILTQKKVERLINKLYSENKIDIIEAPDWTGFTAFMQVKCPLVVRQHGNDTYFCYHDNRKVKFKNKFLEKRALKKADAVISVSQYTGDLTNSIFGLNRDFTVIPNGVDTGLFKPEISTLKKETILYFGTLIRKKGLLELPEIFNHLHQKNKEVELILVGKDSRDIKTGHASTWQLIQPLFSKNSIKKVNYLSAVNYSKIQDLIKEATVCVFPSFAEALPVSWLEAMAMEKAIVASNIGWANEMIEHGAEGYLVHPTNHKKYAECIQDLLMNPKKRQAFGVAARKKVKAKFSHDLVARQSVEFYKNILNS